MEKRYHVSLSILYLNFLPLRFENSKGTRSERGFFEPRVRGWSFMASLGGARETRETGKLVSTRKVESRKPREEEI